MTHRALAASALVACLLVGGCTGDPEPIVADPSPSASPTAPTTTAVADPDQAYRDFIASYVSAISDSLSTGDPTAWLAMSDPACENCRVFAENLRAAYADGGRITGGRWGVKKAVFDQSAELGEVWLVDVTSARETWLDGDGDVVKVVKPGLNLYGFAISGEPERLLLRELRFRES